MKDLTAKNKLSNEVRNHGKEKSSAMHLVAAVRIDGQLSRHAEKMAAKAEKAARKAA